MGDLEGGCNGFAWSEMLRSDGCQSSPPPAEEDPKEDTAEGAEEDASLLDKVKDKGADAMESVMDKSESVMDDIKDKLGFGEEANEEDIGTEDPDPSLGTTAATALGVVLLGAMTGARLA